MDINEEEGKSCQMQRFLQDVQNTMSEDKSKREKTNKKSEKTKTIKKADIQKKKKRKKAIKLPDFESNRGLFENVLLGKTFRRQAYSPLQKARMNEDIFGLAKNKAEEDIAIINQEIQKQARQLENDPIYKVPLLSDIEIPEIEHNEQVKSPEKDTFEPINQIQTEIQLQSQESLKRPENSPPYNKYDFMELTSSTEIRGVNFQSQEPKKRQLEHSANYNKYDFMEKISSRKIPTVVQAESQELMAKQIQNFQPDEFNFVGSSSPSESDFPQKRTSGFYFQNYLNNRNKIPTQIMPKDLNAFKPIMSFEGTSKSEGRKRKRMRFSPHMY